VRLAENPVRTDRGRITEFIDAVVLTVFDETPPPFFIDNVIVATFRSRRPRTVYCLRTPDPARHRPARADSGRGNRLTSRHVTGRKKLLESRLLATWSKVCLAVLASDRLRIDLFLAKWTNSLMIRPCWLNIGAAISTSECTRSYLFLAEGAFTKV
jgi:hypothetical protein